jgi:hypothetical protein
MAALVIMPLSCDDHMVVAILGEESEDGGREVVGLHCYDCDKTFDAAEEE